jgi:hypothetical protein
MEEQSVVNESEFGQHVFPYELRIAELEAMLRKSRGRHMQRGDFDMQREIDSVVTPEYDRSGRSET